MGSELMLRKVEVIEHEEAQDVHDSCKCIDGRTAPLQVVEKATPRRGGRSVPGVVSRKRSACLEFALALMDDGQGCPQSVEGNPPAFSSILVFWVTQPA